MAFVDFSALKEKVSFGKTIEVLGLEMKQSGNQWRSECPVCRSGGPRGLVITDGKGYFCFADSKGGDQIALVAHILKLSVKDAASHLAQATGNSTGTSNTRTSPRQPLPESETAQGGTKTFMPLAYLESEHIAVEAIGFDLEFAKQHGIGYAGRGILRGTVAIPFRDEQGNLLGYIGATDLTLPADFKSNVVQLKPKSA